MKPGEKANTAEAGEGRAHAKLILLGEHAVVFGHPALAVGAGQGATACAQWAVTPRLAWKASGAPPVPAGLAEQEAFRELIHRLSARAVAVEAQLQVPAGVGLGASAAIGVAIAHAVSELSGHSAVQQVLEAANAWECRFHETPSGVDAAAAWFGGALRFCAAVGATPITVGAPLQLLACRVEAAPPTHRMVASIRALRAERRSFVDATFSKIGSIVERACEDLRRGEEDALGGMMNENHAYLRELGLSTQNLERVRTLALERGALGAKLSGAGGGGCLVALVPAAAAETTLDAFRAEGLWCRRVRLETAAAAAP